MTVQMYQCKHSNSIQSWPVETQERQCLYFLFLCVVLLVNEPRNNANPGNLNWWWWEVIGCADCKTAFFFFVLSTEFSTHRDSQREEGDWADAGVNKKVHKYLFF